MINHYALNIDYLVDCYDGAPKSPRTGTRTDARSRLELDFRRVLKDIYGFAGFSLGTVSPRIDNYNVIQRFCTDDSLNFKIKPVIDKLAMDYHISRAYYPVEQIYYYYNYVTYNCKEELTKDEVFELTSKLFRIPLDECKQLVYKMYRKNVSLEC
jgi:hypothetical protein